MNYYNSEEILNKRLNIVIEYARTKLKSCGLDDSEIDSASNGGMVGVIPIATNDGSPTIELLLVSLLRDCEDAKRLIKRGERTQAAGYVLAAESERHSIGQRPFAESGWKSKTGGSKGGRSEKRRKWADAVAAYLLESCAGKSKKLIWASLEDSADISRKDRSDVPEIESDFGDIEFYKDGDKLCANIDGEPVTPMSKQHFFNHYLKTKKQG